jgi:hypothetical protein
MINFFLKKPLVRFLFIIIFVYLGILKNNQSFNYFLKEISLKNISENFDDIYQKYIKFSENIEKAKNHHKEITAEKKIEDINFETSYIGSGLKKIECGNLVSIFYSYHDYENEIIDINTGTQIIALEPNSDLTLDIISKDVIGTKLGEVRIAKIVGQYKNADEKIKKLLKIANNYLFLEYTITSFEEVKNSNCKKND